MSRSRLAILVAIIAFVIAADQATKRLVRASLMEPREYFGGFLTLLRAENEGAFLSIGANLPAGVRTAIFSGLVGIALIAALYALVTGRITSRSDAAFIIGGGIGNLIDRVVWSGRVTDFAYLKLGPLHTGVFNIADIAITGGVLWLALSSFFTKNDEAKSDTPAAP
jgi:signal peptidase II